jgi:hypothetical protein
MTKEDAKANQDRLAKDFDLGFWYGTNCEKCCGVYPKMEVEGDLSCADVFYVCEVCGRRTKGYVMPWQAQEAWNRHEYKSICTQMSLF